MQTLVIDTSYGSTVGMVGHDPIVETDSRTHVEKLQVNIATTVEQAGLKPENIDRIIVGIGPAPFTGLRAGIVAAKALAFATGAQLIGQNVLSPQVLVRNAEHDGRHHLTLAVNDASSCISHCWMAAAMRPVAAQAKTMTQTLKTAVWKP